MKKPLVILSLTALFFMQSFNKRNTIQAAVSKKSKILVVYFSRVGVTPFPDDIDGSASASVIVRKDGIVGNTGLIAEIIQRKLNADIFQIKTVKSYSENYNKVVRNAEIEERKSARPAVLGKVDNPDSYDIIFLGFPDWYYTMPMPVFTFLEENDFSNKTIIPFCTHGGSRFGHAIQDLKKICPTSNIEKGLEIYESKVQRSEKKINRWLKKLGLF